MAVLGIDWRACRKQQLRTLEPALLRREMKWRPTVCIRESRRETLAKQARQVGMIFARSRVVQGAATVLIYAGKLRHEEGADHVFRIRTRSAPTQSLEELPKHVNWSLTVVRPG